MTAQDWTTPGAWEIAPDLYRIPLAMPSNGLRAVNVYAFRAGDRVTIIDSGWAVPEARAQLDAALQSIGLGLHSIDEFLITHSHSDHITLGVQLRAEFGMKLSVGKDEEPNIRAVMEHWFNGFKMNFHRLRAAGAGSVADAMHARIEANPDAERMAEEYFELPDRWLNDDDIITVGRYRLRAIATPGHTRGHLVFADEAARIIVTGDHVLPTITPSIGFEAQRNGLPLKRFLESQEVMLALPDLRVLPAHGAVTDSLHARSRELIEYHEQRLDECFAAMQSGAADALEVARAIGWTRRLRHFDELDEFNQMLAVTETIAHLDVLADRGLADEDIIDGVKFYRLGQ
ncbi:MBL fold metallo-hydrolase [Microbacterium sp. A94]|uniref:MBL fold metallo-hydrolase n=1 Tax=Microbacterium sp. A94 TaxID=3450717 RepID=UPI003F42DC75